MKLKRSESKRPGKLKPRLKMDPLVRAVRKAYKAGPVYPLDRLLEQDRLWRAKARLADRKLLAVRRKINKMAMDKAQAALRAQG